MPTATAAEEGHHSALEIVIDMLLFWILVASFLIQTGYWLFFFRQLAKVDPVANSPCPLKEGISVIICTRNEEENLRRNLPLVLQQDYLPYEVIVVDDHSTDGSLQLLLDFQEKSNILRVIKIQEPTLPGKKQALARGIAEAKYSWLLLTDADAAPISTQWISGMCAAVAKNTGMILGYSPFITEKGCLNLFIRFEALWVAVQYLSFALRGLPYMGVGRNLMYEKSLYASAGGFVSHADLASGDDDLFVNGIASAENTRICIDPRTFVYSKPKSTFTDYYRQKRRHLSTATRYQPLHQYLLGGLSLSHFLFLFCTFLSLFSPFWPAGLLFYGIRLSISWLIFWRIAAKLKDPQAGRWFPLLDLSLMLFYILFASSLFFSKDNRW